MSLLVFEGILAAILNRCLCQRRSESSRNTYGGLLPPAVAANNCKLHVPLIDKASSPLAPVERVATGRRYPMHDVGEPE
jgi:hypothetical protein